MALRKTPATVLMYHAVPSVPADNAGADAHYSVQASSFVMHLDDIAQAGAQACAVEVASDIATPVVCITFDDGHVTNFKAAELLAQRRWGATFFVNSSTVGTPHFLSWAQLREMRDMGMSIQSHAHHHRYMDDLSDDEQFDELSTSRKEIEDQLGAAVTTFAPPGGRISARTGDLAKKAGYQRMCTSRVGLYDFHEDGAWDIPRFALLASTSEAQVRAWIRQSPIEISRQVWRYKSLRFVKNMMGNGGYDKLRATLLGTKGDY